MSPLWKIFGYIRQNCKEWVRTKPEAGRRPETPQASQETRNKLKANRAEVRWRESSSSDSESSSWDSEPHDVGEF